MRYNNLNIFKEKSKDDFSFTMTYKRTGEKEKYKYVNNVFYRTYKTDEYRESLIYFDSNKLGTYRVGPKVGLAQNRRIQYPIVLETNRKNVIAFMNFWKEYGNYIVECEDDL